MVSEINFELGCGINVAFGSVRWWALWQPLRAPLLLMPTGLDEARLFLLLRGAVTSNIFRSKQNLWRKQRLPGYCERQVWKYNSCPFHTHDQDGIAKQKSLLTLQLFIVSHVTPLLCWKIYGRMEEVLQNTSGACMSSIQTFKPLLPHTYTVVDPRN